jgi:hypothetical protein
MPRPASRLSLRFSPPPINLVMPLETALVRRSVRIPFGWPGMRGETTADLAFFRPGAGSKANVPR